MTEGISKERLLFWNGLDTKDLTSHELLEILLRECAELDPWIPIDENTPKDRQLLLNGEFYQCTGQWCDIITEWVDDGNRIMHPTHYQELPDDPKEQEHAKNSQTNSPSI